MNTVKESEPILRRFLKPWVEFSDWTILVPVLFAFVVLLLVFAFRREKKLSGLLWSGMFVGILAVAYLLLAVTLRPMFTWWVILVPCLGVALFYVGMMYFKDCQTIHPAWATFLGLLRVGVYAILTLVFLLPALQYYEASFQGSKVVLAFDVSESMIKGIAEVPEEDQDPKTVANRQEKIIDWLAAANEKETPIERMLRKSPVSIYRFGGTLDDKNVLHIKTLDEWKAKGWNREQWAKFLKPEPPEMSKELQAEEDRIRDEETKIKEEEGSLKDGADSENVKALQLRRERLRLAQEKLEEKNKTYRAEVSLARDLRGGTNIGRALQQIAELESGQFLQAIMLFSDGQSNLGTEDDVKTFQAKVQKAKTAVHLFTVGVGTFLPPVSLRIDELQGPKVARPDDKFPVRVPVIGTGLAERPFKVFLDLERLGKGEEKKNLGFVDSKFKGGDVQEETVEFEIDLKELYKEELEGAKTELAAKNTEWPRDKVEQEALNVLEGKYQLTARVPRMKGESFSDPEHVSKPFIVQVQKHKPRILLFAGGPSREYQFLRTLLFREVTADRMELSILLQTTQEGTDQDVKGDKLLTRFPETLERGAKEGSLADFDLIIALDPDWTALSPEQFKLIQTWVDAHAGGIIFVAGPVHTFHLAHSGGLDISPLLTVFPVKLKDSRLHGLSLDHDPSRPYALQFTASAKQYDFLNLEEVPENPTSGWDKFFWADGPKPEPGKEARPERGMHNYYPVESLKADSIVLAHFMGNEKSKIDGRDPQPFLVLMRYGQGKTLYLSSPETWRLRLYKEALHERLWIKMARFMAASTALKTNLGYISLSSEYTTGAIPFEAQLKGENGLPLPRDAQVTVNVNRPPNFEPRIDRVTPAKFHLQPKPTQGEWKGWFTGTFKVQTPGKYEFNIPIPGTQGSVSHEIFVRTPNLEMDNLRTDFPVLWHLATGARPITNRVKNAELERAFKTPPVGVDSRELGRDSGRLFLELKHANYLPDCLVVEEPRTVGEKTNIVDTWDEGLRTGMELTLYAILMWVLDGVGFLVIAILLITKRQWSALAVFVAAFALVHGMIGLNAYLGSADEPSEGLMNVLLIFAYLIGGVGLAGTLLLTAWNREWAILATVLGFALTMFILFLCDRLKPPELPWWTLPVDFSFILVAAVGLLSVEWLTRKLLKLA